MTAVPSRARHRAACRPLTPLTGLVSEARSRLAGTSARAGVVAASSGLALALFATPASALPGTGTATAFDVVALPPSVQDTSPVVTVAEEVEWSFEVPEYTVKPDPEPVPRVAAASRSGTRAPRPAALTADGVPADLAPYGNGNVPSNRLAPIGSTGHKLWAPAAQAFERLLAAARADGVSIGITSSYRPYATQVSLAHQKGIYGRGGLAAVPGTSDHGWGRSVDLRLDAGAQAWMRANAGRFGFVEDVAGEPWHWTFTPR